MSRAINMTSSPLLLAPSEVVLEIFKNVPTEATTIRDLSLIHPRFYAILKSYEKSHTEHVRPLHALNDFPRKHPDEKKGYAWLSKCVRQYDIMDDLMDRLYYAQPSQLADHNQVMVYAGFFLLYQVSEKCKFAFSPASSTIANISIGMNEGHDKAIEFIQGLPLDPLTAMALAIWLSYATARYTTEGLLKTRHVLDEWAYETQYDEVRLKHELEFAFKECALCNGPGFILETFNNEARAEKDLLNIYHETSLLYEIPGRTDVPRTDTSFWPQTQGPKTNPDTPQRTLWTTLVESIADKGGIPLDFVEDTIIDRTNLPDHVLANLSLYEKERLVAGKNVSEEKEVAESDSD